jgi:predicted alpha/beta-fold hydrolase
LESLDELYAYGSVIHYINGLHIPVLFVNAKNDPLLPDSCYPWEIAERNKFLYLEVPERGGHVGFFNGSHDMIWSEKRTLEFFRDEKL